MKHATLTIIIALNVVALWFLYGYHAKQTESETITFAATQPPKGTTFTLIIWHPHLAAIKPAKGWTYTSEPLEGAVKITATKE